MVGEEPTPRACGVPRPPHPSAAGPAAHGGDCDSHGFSTTWVFFCKKGYNFFFFFFCFKGVYFFFFRSCQYFSFVQTYATPSPSSISSCL